jgi:hypothetical protein
MSWYRAPLWDLRPDITFCQNVAVWNFQSCFCGAPSLTRGRVCRLSFSVISNLSVFTSSIYVTCVSQFEVFEVPYDWRSVSQYVLVSSILVGLASRYYFLSECCCLKFAVLFLWGTLSDERTGLQFAVQSLNGPSRAEPVTILYCLIWDSVILEGQVPIFTSTRNMVAPGTGLCFFQIV